MYIPTNLNYTSHHLWIRPVGKKDIYIGITDYAQKELGRIDSFDISKEGELKNKDDAFGSIYGTNKTLELVMPFTGRFLILNDEIQINPGLLNSDPYYHWIMLVTLVEEYKKDETLFSWEKYNNLILQLHSI